MQNHAFRVYKPGGKPAATAKATKQNQENATAPSTWINHDSFVSGESRKDIRAQAARASAAARRATLAKKQARRYQQPGSQLITFAASNGEVQDHEDFKREVNKAMAKSKSSDQAEQAFFQRLVGIITPLLEQRPLSLEQPGEISLAHSTIRTMMWDGMTRSTTLFQVAIFVAGTHSNTCGLPRSVFVHMGPGLVALRGASLDAIQAKIASGETESESIAPVAIALLAGWERRYGDSESYAVHMKAWKSLPLPSKSLEEQSIATLTDLTLEMYRHGLDETAKLRSDANSLEPMAALPSGFHRLNRKRTEARSLLALVAQLARHGVRAEGEVERLRKIGLENMSWSPTHSFSYEPKPEQEDQIDSMELMALYHIRAANIPICGIMLQATMDHHNVKWQFDLNAALWIHTCSCVHLKTEALMGTKYEELAVWARFSLCALARDPAQDAYITQLLQRLGLTTWKSLRAMLERHLYHESFDTSFSTLFELLMKPSDDQTKTSETGYETMMELLV